MDVAFLAPAGGQQCLGLGGYERENAACDWNLDALMLLLRKTSQQSIKKHSLRLLNLFNWNIIVAKRLKLQHRMLNRLFHGLIWQMLYDEIDEIEGAHLPIHDHLKQMSPNQGSLIKIVDLAKIIEEGLESFIVISDFTVCMIARIEQKASHGAVALDLNFCELFFIAYDYVLYLMLSPRVTFVK